jgi:hypothetical protein
MSTKEKIIEYLRVKGISKTKFSTDTGLSNGFLDSGNSLGVDKLKIIISKYPDINLNWLVSDQGEMIKTDLINDPISSYNKVCKDCVEKQKQIDTLQQTVFLLKDQVEESKKDRELIRDILSQRTDQTSKSKHSA